MNRMLILKQANVVADGKIDEYEDFNLYGTVGELMDEIYCSYKPSHQNF